MVFLQKVITLIRFTLMTRKTVEQTTYASHCMILEVVLSHLTGFLNLIAPITPIR